MYRVGSGEHAIEQHAKAVDIALNCGFAAAQHLRCEIQGRAGERAQSTRMARSSPTRCRSPSVPLGRRLASITFCALMSRWRRPASWTAETARQIWMPISIVSEGFERQSPREPLLDRLAVDQFHPETDGVPDPLGSVNGDDVGMADAREEAAFLDDRGRARISGIGSGRQELQRNFAIETGVPGAVHAPECAAADRLQDADVPPCLLAVPVRDWRAAPDGSRQASPERRSSSKSGRSVSLAVD